MKPKNELIEITSVGGMLEAEAIKSYLESQDIPVFLQSESLGTISGLFSGPLAKVKIFVPQDDAAEAKRLIAESSGNASDSGRRIPRQH
jgi:hypothetical protein